MERSFDQEKELGASDPKLLLPHTVVCQEWKVSPGWGGTYRTQPSLLLCTLPNTPPDVAGLQANSYFLSHHILGLPDGQTALFELRSFFSQFALSFLGLEMCFKTSKELLLIWSGTIPLAASAGESLASTVVRGLCLMSAEILFDSDRTGPKEKKGTSLHSTLSKRILYPC